MESTYTKQAAEFLAQHSITFSVMLVGDDCPNFCDDARKHLDMDQLNTFPRRTHIHGKHYLVTFKREHTAGQTSRTQSITMDFWNSYADEQHNWALKNRIKGMASISCESYKVQDMIKAELQKGKERFEPTPYDVLACLQKNHPGTFEDFAADYGYDTDSRRAMQTYEAVLQEWGKVSAFFSSNEIEQMQEIS
jgi:hypothetical protein